MKILITGGLGFIGINTALRLKDKHEVTLLDNLSKPSSVENYHKYQANFKIIITDVKNYQSVKQACKNKDFVIHLAAQTAVTKSIDNPLLDFESNCIGTFNILEAIRNSNISTRLIYASTNKVYGDLYHYGFEKNDLIKRYVFYDKILKDYSINERERLNFYSPYGCSKGSADQYVKDYARIYGLKTYVLRQSCIYGIHQDGTEDQGWVAWFVKQALNDNPITVFGDGYQVRDILYIDDLVDFYEIIIDNDIHEGIFNIGGGIRNSISLIQLIKFLESKLKKEIELKYSKERLGDQKLFISDNTKAEGIGWKVKTDIETGLDKLINYLR